jgi:hypothetical protein
VRTGRRTLRIVVHRADARALGGGKLAAASNAIWVGAPVHVDDDPIVGNASGWVGRIELSRPRLRVTPVYGDPPAEIGVGRSGVWVTGGRTLRHFDAISGRQIETIRLPHALGAVAVGANAVWLDEPNRGRLLRIDPKTRKVRASILIGRSVAGSSLALGAVLWATTDYGVVGVDPVSGAVVTRIPLRHASAIAVDGAHVFALASDGLYSIVQSRATKRLALPSNGGELLAAAAGIVWLSDGSSNSLRRVVG